MTPRYKSRKQLTKFRNDKHRDTVYREKQRRKALHTQDPDTGKGTLRKAV